MTDLPPRAFIPMPDAVEPSMMKVVDLHAETIESGKRLRVFIQITPFLESPFVVVTLKNHHDVEVCTARIIEPALNRMSIVMHIRQNQDEAGQYSLTASIEYPTYGQVANLETKYNEDH